jgi:serine/threonine protein kinase
MSGPLAEEYILSHQELLGNFQPLAVLGKGSYGLVISAQERKTNRKMAVKVRK